jgi:hypothetical protein
MPVNKTGKSNINPSFISFNIKQKTSTVSKDRDRGSNFTVLHGRFTSAELAAFISELEKVC